MMATINGGNGVVFRQATIHTYLPIFLVFDHIPKIDQLPLLDHVFELADLLACRPHLLGVFRQFIAHVSYPGIPAAGIPKAQPVPMKLAGPVRFIVDLCLG